MLSNRLRDLSNRYSKKFGEARTQDTLVSRKREVLRFRDLADDTSIIQIHGDFFATLKTLGYGSNYAIDFALQRELEYTSVHAMHELQINEGKLFEGPKALLKSGIPFPAIADLKSFEDYRSGTHRSVALTYRSFKKPTLVHTMLGSAPSSALLSQWSDLIPHDDGSPLLDVINLFNFQGFSSRVLRRYLVRSIDRLVHDSPGNHYYGENIVPKLMSTFDIRNFYMNYVMLVDHKGHVRWMSGWKPSTSEKQNFPLLCESLASMFSNA